MRSDLFQSKLTLQKLVIKVQSLSLALLQQLCVMHLRGTIRLGNAGTHLKLA
jgi:hypothetical protein